MSWVRIDDGFTEHPKILALTLTERWIHMRALTYAARRRDPHIPAVALNVIGATRKHANRLADVGVWDVNGDGWVIHDWRDYQGPMTDAERQAKRRRNRDTGATDE